VPRRVCFNAQAAVNMDVVPLPMPVPPTPVRTSALAVLVATGTRPAAHVQLSAPVPPAAAAITPPLQIAPLQPVFRTTRPLLDRTFCPITVQGERCKANYKLGNGKVMQSHIVGHFADPAAGEACFKQFVDDGQVRLGFCRGVYWFYLSVYAEYLQLCDQHLRVFWTFHYCVRSQPFELTVVQARAPAAAVPRRR